MATVTLPTEIQPHSPQGDFRNEPFTNFKEPATARQMQAALDLVASQLGHEYDLIIGGHRLRTDGKIKSLNPARPAQVVGIHQKAGAEHAEKAMQAALEAFETWSRTSIETRVSLLLGAAQIIRQRKLEFCAWLTYEVGKNWAEADADVGETIDFLEFYAREALRLSKAETPIQLAGELDQLMYIRGSGDSAVEFPVCNHGRDDRGFGGDGEYGDSQTLQRLADDCGEVCRGSGRGWPARWSCELLSGIGREFWERDC